MIQKSGSTILKIIIYHWSFGVMSAVAPLEVLLSNFPVHLNPIWAVVYVVALAYFAHFYKLAFVYQRAKELKKRLSFADSRNQSELFSDSSATGVKIARCAGCHSNGLEALVCFGIALSLAILCHVPRDLISGASGAFVAIRVLYSFVYLTGLNGPLRSIVWGVGSAVWVTLLISAASRY